MRHIFGWLPAGLVALWALGLAVPVLAQQMPPTQAELRTRAIERCKASRGVDCETSAGLQEWITQEQPITDQQRSNAAGARLHREQCRASPRKPGC